MKDLLLKVSVILAVMASFSIAAKAQFKEEAFSQSYVDPSDTTGKGEVDQMWTFKEFFNGVAKHDSTLRIGSLFAGSTVFIGAEQFYNRQYWKIPVIYAGLGSAIGMGLHYRGQYKDSQKAYDEAFALDPETTLKVDEDAGKKARAMFAAAGLIYWGALMDGVITYKKDVKSQPGKATLYSILLPGLGQCYNGEYWKVPIYWGALIGSYHYYTVNERNYKRYKRIHNEATASDGTYTGVIPAERALYFRNVFRRFRDYSVVAIAGSYLLQVIDANVFAYMGDFEVNDDLSMKISPTVISPYNEYAFNTSSGAVPMSGSYFSSYSFGLKLGLTF